MAPETHSHEEAAECCICGFTVTTHPDDSQGGLAYCGDCGKPTCRAHRDDTQAQRCHRCAGKLMTLFEGDELALDIARARARQPAELRERFCQICGPFMLDSCPIFRRTGAHDLRPKEQP